jgi:UDP-2,3-diacylglucosamine pyrophosphatase LpxH
MYICISDIHLGHIRVNAETIYQKLVSQFYPHLSTSEGLFIAGDFFDQLITMDSMGAQYAAKIIQELIQMAEQYGFFIRVLRGTFGHDRNQMKLFETIGSYHPKVDLKYFSTIDVESINDRHNLKVLYIPDSLPYKSTEEAIQYIYKLLETNKINKVDLVIGHGYFDHVLPFMAHTKIVFTYEMFKDIVNGFVIFGHVHTHSAFKNVLYCGSFDRLMHGEEEAKGFLKIERTPTWKCTFIKNELSTPFVTIPIDGDMDELESIVEKLPDKVNKRMDISHGYLRFIVKSPELKVALLSRVPYLFPQLSITIKVLDGSSDEPVVLNSDVFELIELGSVPTRETLTSDIINFLSQYRPDTKLTQELIEEKLALIKFGK